MSAISWLFIFCDCAQMWQFTGAHLSLTCLWSLYRLHYTITLWWLGSEDFMFPVWLRQLDAAFPEPEAATPPRLRGAWRAVSVCGAAAVGLLSACCRSDISRSPSSAGRWKSDICERSTAAGTRSAAVSVCMINMWLSDCTYSICATNRHAAWHCCRSLKAACLIRFDWEGSRNVLDLTSINIYLVSLIKALQ